uniref:DNA 3'-5' helicase n=1 Tax=Amphimedon queenslandica TaxID=400682 RepID=A0A1X7U5W1_AMPQE
MSTQVLFCMISNKTRLRSYMSYGVPNSHVIEEHVKAREYGSCGQDSVLCRRGSGILGYISLKSEQQYIITEFLKGKDVFAVLPTGYGKTACSTCLPSAFDKYEERTVENKAIIVVVSPLTALICDQVEDLIRRNVSAGYIDSESTQEVKKNVAEGVYSIVFMSPEQL